MKIRIIITLVEHVSVFYVGHLWTVLQFLSSCMEEQSARDLHTDESVDKVVYQLIFLLGQPYWNHLEIN